VAHVGHVARVHWTYTHRRTGHTMITVITIADAHTVDAMPEPTYGTPAWREWWVAGRMVANVADGMTERGALVAARSASRTVGRTRRDR
jgi:hypothetical protein